MLTFFFLFAFSTSAELCRCTEWILPQEVTVLLKILYSLTAWNYDGNLKIEVTREEYFCFAKKSKSIKSNLLCFFTLLQAIFCIGLFLNPIGFNRSDFLSYIAVVRQVFRIVTRKPNFKQPLPAISAHLTALIFLHAFASFLFYVS